jgi:amino-acid N-acetyltransferase
MADIPPVGEDDLQGLRGLLSEAGLPEDVGEHHSTLLAVARDGAEVIGGVAVEVYEGHGLLRSLVVDPRFRSSGIGTGLVGAAEAAAGSHGLAGLSLLTETAAPFFLRLGYTAVDRDEVPEPVRASSEFTRLCPDTAAAMVKRL